MKSPPFSQWGFWCRPRSYRELPIRHTLFFFRLVGPWIRQEVGKIVKNVSMPGILKVDTLNNWSIWQRDFSKLDITSFYSNVHNHPRLGGQQILQAAPNTPSEGWQHGSRESWAIHLHCGYVLPTHAVMGWSIGAWLCIPWKKTIAPDIIPIPPCLLMKSHETIRFTMYPSFTSALSRLSPF